jgi:hypothetical protein
MKHIPVLPCDWPGPVAASLTALWDAVDAADHEMSKAIRDNSPPRPELKRLREEFKTARHQLVGLLLETLAPQPDDLDRGTAEEEDMTAGAGHATGPAT